MAAEVKTFNAGYYSRGDAHGSPRWFRRNLRNDAVAVVRSKGKNYEVWEVM